MIHVFTCYKNRPTINEDDANIFSAEYRIIVIMKIIMTFMNNNNRHQEDDNDDDDKERDIYILTHSFKTAIVTQNLV